MEALYHYRNEYLADFQRQQSTHQSLPASSYQHYYRFLDQLDEAIKQQAEKLPELEAHLQRCLTAWQALHHKRKAFAQLIQKHEDERLYQEQTLEQVLEDEFVMRMQHWKRSRD